MFCRRSSCVMPATVRRSRVSSIGIAKSLHPTGRSASIAVISSVSRPACVGAVSIYAMRLMLARFASYHIVITTVGGERRTCRQVWRGLQRMRADVNDVM